MKIAKQDNGAWEYRTFKSKQKIVSAAVFDARILREEEEGVRVSASDFGDHVGGGSVIEGALLLPI